MNYTDDIEYVFWLDGWVDSTTFFAKNGRFKCTITKNKIVISSVEHKIDDDLEVSIDSIRGCKFEYQIRSVRRFTALILDNKRIILFPVNPIDPNHILITNHSEAVFLLEVINSFLSNVEAKVSANPYLRHPSVKTKFKYYRSINDNWDQDIPPDKNVSPWTYYDLYGDKFVLLKLFISIAAMVIVSTLLVFCIVFLLDWLNII